MLHLEWTLIQHMARPERALIQAVLHAAGTLAGVIGVAVTGRILDGHGGAAKRGGWYAAEAMSSVVCVGAMCAFSIFARGERMFD
jgi:hypothetical protein